MSLSEAPQKLQLACQVCLSQYDSQDHRPLLLPACGHTFCAFCVEQLDHQGKRFCPKCRKDGAVQPVSSLPVNYSLLDVAENNSCGAAAAAAVRPNPSSLHRTKTDSSDLSKKHLQTKQKNSQIPKLKNITNHPIPVTFYPQHQPRRPAVNSFMSKYVTQATGTLSAHNPNPSPTHTMLEREQQDELDLQMVAHFPFCKDGAVQPVSFLPVNYSLLDVAENNSCGAAAAAAAVRPNPLSLHRTRTDSSDLLSKALHLHKTKQMNSQIPKEINITNRPIPATFYPQHQPRRPAVNPFMPRYVTPATGTLSAHNSAPNPTHTMLEREQQEELDFQMAVHLTFCKDKSHDHDLHTSCSSWCWQNPEDEDTIIDLTDMQ